MYMSTEKIEKLKSILIQSARKGCSISCSSHGIQGRMVGVGFKPFWTNPGDSKISRLDLNYMDNHGTIRTFYLSDIIGYDAVFHDSETIEDSNSLTLDIHVYSPSMTNSTQPYDVIRVDFNS